MEPLQCAQLVDLLCKVPVSGDFEGRTALLVDLPSIRRDESSPRTDLTNAVAQLEDLGGDAMLARLIDNAVSFTRGTPLGQQLLELRPVLTRAELQISASDFDLTAQQQSLLDAVLGGKGLVGCAIRTGASVVQRVLSERLRDQLGPDNLSIKEFVVLSPTRPVAPCVKRVSLYRPELSRRDVLVPIWVTSSDALASLWAALSALMADAHETHTLVVLFFLDDAVLVPAGLTELPAPRVYTSDVYTWTLGCLRKLKPAPAQPEARARRWTTALMLACTDADGMPIDRVFDALDSAIEALQSDDSPGALDRLTGGTFA